LQNVVQTTYLGGDAACAREDVERRALAHEDVAALARHLGDDHFAARDGRWVHDAAFLQQPFDLAIHGREHLCNAPNTYT
jgi:hypothetical protein